MVWLPELLLVLVLCGVGVTLARMLGPTRLWLLTFVLALTPIVMLLLGHRIARLAFLPPVSWVVDPDIAPLLMALAVPCMLTTLATRLPARPQRRALGLLTVLMSVYYALLPILLPLLVRPSLNAGTTNLDRNAICLQTHAYTCGPAAAVTCLRLIHIPADEAPLAIEARSAPIEGTDGHRLSAAINHLTRPHQLLCTFQFVDSLDQLSTPAIATIFSPRYGNHYVAVLQVTPTEVILGDPLSGRDRYTRAEFLAQWTGATHTFSVLQAIIPLAPVTPAA